MSRARSASSAASMASVLSSERSLKAKAFKLMEEYSALFRHGTQLVDLEGFISKKMIYDVYGEYIDGLESDMWDIANYFGRDYL